MGPVVRGGLLDREAGASFSGALLNGGSGERPLLGEFESPLL